MSKQEFPDSNHFQIKQVTEGVYEAIASDEGGAICNAGIVDLGESLVVFDSFLTPLAALDMRNIAEQTIGKHVQYLINSYYHNDHVRGNQVFSSNVTIIATKQCRELIETKGVEEIKYDRENSTQQLKNLTEQFYSEKERRKKYELKTWISYYQHIIDSLPDIKLILPNLTFNKKLTLSGSKRTVEIINTGDGHTENDVVMYVSGDKILFTGDLVFAKCHPYLADGYPKKWVNTLNKLSDLEIHALIPGHGPIGTKKDMDLMVRYITDLEELANKIRNEDETTRKTTINNVPPLYDTWLFGDFFYPMNIQFLIESQTREP